jgi:autotransporter-associated beta strand protein
MRRHREHKAQSRRSTTSRQNNLRWHFQLGPEWSPAFEGLESRIVLSPPTFVWTGADYATSENWSDAANWQGSQAPTAGSALVFPSGASAFNPVNDDSAGTTFSSIDIQSSGYDISGAAIQLSGNLNASLTSGVSIDELATTLGNGIIDIHSGGDLIALGKFSGVSGLELTGGGQLNLQGTTANNYSGTTTVDSGTLVLDNLPGRYAIPGNLVIGNTSTGILHDTNSNEINPSSTVTVNTSGDLNIDGNTENIGALNLNGSARVYTGIIDGSVAGLLTVGGTITADGTSGTPSVTGVVNLGSSDRTFDVTAGTVDWKATTQGTHALIKTGTGTLFFDNISYQDTGAVDVNTGIFYVQGGSSINNGSSSGISVSSGATLQVLGTGTISEPVHVAGTGAGGIGAVNEVWYGDTLSDLILAGNASIGSTTGNTGLIISNPLTDGEGSYSLTKVGNGEVVLSGDNTYSGGTTVNNGLLYVSGTIGGTTQVAANGQIGGSGVVGDVTSTGGMVGAGGQVFYQTQDEQFSSITLDSSSTFVAQINGAQPGSNYDQANVTGAVSLNGATLSLPNSGYTPGANDPIDIIKGATSLTGTFNGLSEGAMVNIAGYTFKITYLGGTGGHDVILNRIVNTTTSVAIPANSSVYSQPVTFTATVNSIQGGTPTGTVTFYQGQTNLGNGTLSGNTATLTTTILPVGSDSITAVYNGDTHDLTSNSTNSPVTQIVIKDFSTSTVTTSNASTVFGQSVTITATVAANAPGVGNPTGTVDIYDGTTLIGTPTLSNGVATLVTTSLATEAHQISFNYLGDAGFFVSNATAITQTVGQASTTISAPTTSDASTFGQSVTFSATVAAVSPGSGTPTGTVKFYDGMTLLGSGTLNDSGVATYSTTSLTAGMHTITASYNGDVNFTSASSSSTTQTVSKSSTTNTLATSISEAAFGQPVTLTATVAAVSPGAGIATGTVQFYNGATLLGSATLDDTGVATLITGALNFGAQTVSAVYEGDSNFNTSTSNTQTVSITLASATFSISSPDNPAVYGQSPEIDVTLSPPFQGAGTATGTVTFLEGATTLGTATLSSGSATITLSPLSLGTHMITVSYPGDSNYQPGTSSAFSLVVNAANTATTISPPTEITFGQLASLSVSVTARSPGAGTPTGTVSFYEGSTLLGTGTLSSGTASISASSLAAGTHTITATYSGDADFNSSNAAPVSLVVDKETSSATLSQPSTIVYGQAGTLTVTVASTIQGAGTPTGQVTFYDGQTIIGIVSLTTGSATLNPTGLSAGMHTISVVYGGDGNFLTDTSSNVTLTVNKSSTTATLTPPTTVVFGQPATLVATVVAVSPGGGTPAGTVTFKDGATTLGTATLNGSGVATYFATSLAVGSHTITALYSGNSNYTTSTASSVSQVVNKSSSLATVEPTTPVVFGQPATISASLSAVAPSSGIPTGTVTFKEGATTLGTATLDGSGTASITLANLSVGSHSITAYYGGDPGFFSSTSLSVAQSVSQSSTTATVSPPTSIILGHSAILAVTLSTNSPGSGTPFGSVTFYDNGTVLGIATLSGSGTASISVAGLEVGTHPITVHFAGDLDFLATTSSIADLVVNAEATTTTISPVTTSSTFGQSVTFTASVISNDPETLHPTGTVGFYDGLTLLGLGTLNNQDVATFSLNSLNAGSHSISAVYNGDSEFLTSHSSNTNQVINPAQTSTAISTSLPSPVFGQDFTLTATVVPNSTGTGIPTGTVAFYEGSLLLGTASLDQTGKAVDTFSHLPVGNDPVTARYLGANNFSVSNSTNLTEIVRQASSHDVLTSSDPSRTYGQAVTFTATIAATSPGAGVPTGSVAFYDGMTLVGTSALNGESVATLTISTLDAGSLSMTAHYLGDINFVGSTTPAISEHVTPASTTMSLTVPGIPAVFGQLETLVANVQTLSPGVGTPVGTAQFFEGTTSLGSANLINGVATLKTTGISYGTQVITAKFIPNSDFLGSTSSPQSQIVGQSLTTTQVTGGGSAVFGQSVAFHATVAPVAPATGIPTGYVLFEDGQIPIAAASLNAQGVASVQVSTLGIGSHSINAVYAGNGQYTNSIGSPVGASVAKSPTVVTVASMSPIYYGQSATLTLTVTPVASGSGTPTGNVIFFDGSTPLGTRALSGGAAYLVVPGLAGGNHNISAFYTSDENFLYATAAPTTLQVLRILQVGSLTPPNPVVYGQYATLQASVSSSIPGLNSPGGSVIFYDGTARIGTAIVQGGVATLSLNNFSVGVHSISAGATGDGNFLPITLSPVFLSVTPAATSATMLSTTPIIYGQSAKVSAVVAVVAPGSGTPTGTVTFYDGANMIGTATLSNGTATLTTAPSALAPGTRLISASYAGSLSFQPSMATRVVQLVAPAITGTVYLDANANGVLDAGEAGLSGRFVFLDLKKTGTFVAGDPSAVTDASGRFTFYGIAQGTASVLESLTQDAYYRNAIDQTNVDPSGNVNIGVVPVSSVAPVPVVTNPFPAGPVPATAASSAYVRSLYETVLGRSAGSSEVAFWVNQMNQGMSRQQVAATFVNSPEHRQDEVDTYYEEFLHRPADPSAVGLVSAMLSGVSEEQVVEFLLDSAEYQAQHQDSALFIRDLYIDVLGHTATNAEIAGWQADLASGVSRQTIVKLFVESSEEDTDIVSGLCLSYLHRPADSSLLATGVAALQSGVSASSVALTLLDSDEFYNDSQS